MPKYPNYQDCLRHDPIHKGSRRNLVAPLRGGDHDIIEAAEISSMTFNGFPENDPDEAEPTFLPPNTNETVVWTFGVGPCHVLCMYGWKYLLDGWLTAISLLHLTDVHTIPQGLDACFKVLQQEGFTDSVTSYIIGGQPQSHEKLLYLINGEKSDPPYNTRRIVAPLTTNNGGAAVVAAMRAGMVFNVYDETIDVEPQNVG